MCIGMKENTQAGNGGNIVLTGKKILYITTVGGTMSFFEDMIKQLTDEGYVVDIATNEFNRPVPDFYRTNGYKIFSLSCSRFPLNKGNIKAVKEIREIVSNGNYDIVHCHTPIAGAVTRLACRKFRKNGLKVFYTAHGFHFYKGAPFKNWLIYYPIEKLCSRFTDVLITINHEDYELAKKKMKAKRIEYVPGVGIDVEKFSNAVVDRAAKRSELGIPEDAFLLISVGELNENKNHQVVIRALAQLNNPNIHYMIAGKGPLDEQLKLLSQKLGVENQVHLLGYRNDVAELYKTADVNVFPSIREGLGLAAVEGVAAGLPLICSDNRGTREFAVHNENAIVCRSHSITDFCNAISKLYSSCEDALSLEHNGSKKVERFRVENVNAMIRSIYAGE